MWPILAVAASCAAWHPAATGFYAGPVISGGTTQTIDTWITLDDDGRLSGRYVLHEAARDVHGTLEMVADDGCNTTLFRWTDLYGNGIKRLQFFPAEHCFEGTWGRLVLNPQLTIGTCNRPKVTS
jgi:hypothetical protein